MTYAHHNPVRDFPPPSAFGLPSKFHSWRPNQPDAITQAHDSPHPLVVQVQPTGSGKSLCYMTLAALSGRTVILTSTKGLQDQLMADFRDSTFTVADIRGRNSYRCRAASLGVWVSCDEGPCALGVKCELRHKGCEYYDALARARQADVVITNYTCWMVNQKGFLGEVDFLVCDEGHDVINHILDSMHIGFRRQEVRHFTEWLSPDSGSGQTIRWAESLKCAVEAETEDVAKGRKPVPPDAVKALVAIARKSKRLALFLAAPGDWVVDHQGDRVVFDPVWPTNMAEEFLYKGVPRVYMTSATISPKVPELLGLDMGATEYSEWPSTFPVANRRVLHIPTVRMDHRIDNAGFRLWLTRIDQIIRGRLDRKGIVHTVSYDRRTRIVNTSEYSRYMMAHESRTAAKVVGQFKSAAPPRVLVSPSMVTGWDFPGADCRYQIIGKLPFPDQRSKVDKARRALDPEWGPLQTMTQLVQMVGRGVRSEEDYCETFIIDDHWSWFGNKFRKFAPAWFWDSVGRVSAIPKAPGLGRRTGKGME